MITCPNCRQPVNANLRYCETCGVDLAIAAGMAEQQIRIPGGLPEGIVLAPEVLAPRIGEYMIERGLISSDDLQRALEHQHQRLQAGRPLLLGQALLDLGLIDREILDGVIIGQILELQSALNEANTGLQRRVQERTAELQAALERLSELSILKSNIIANISHELRTPLTHLKGYLDLLSENGLGPLTTQQNEAIVVMRRAEERLERMIEDLIQFSLATRGELNLNWKHFDLNQTIEIVVERSVGKAQARQVHLHTDLSNGLPRVRGDEEKITWVLSQLIDNAVKFTPPGGRVEVRTRIEKDSVCVVVLDSGIGIPSERLLEIFEPFHQLDGSATRRYSGAGLGLALVRRIIEAHGATIKVDSHVGKGSRFEFSLPAVLVIRPKFTSTQVSNE